MLQWNFIFWQKIQILWLIWHHYGQSFNFLLLFYRSLSFLKWLINFRCKFSFQLLLKLDSEQSQCLEIALLGRNTEVLRSSTHWHIFYTYILKKCLVELGMFCSYFEFYSYQIFHQILLFITVILNIINSLYVAILKSAELWFHTYYVLVMHEWSINQYGNVCSHLCVFWRYFNTFPRVGLVL